MDPGNQHHYHHHYNPSYLQAPYLNLTQDVVVVSGGGGDPRERLPQWSNIETKEFLGLRWELDRSFMETKRNKVLWELVSTKMKEKGFYRTPDQCKCKWKNLVTRYKGSEAMEVEMNRQFPFQEDMRRIFSDRMERLLSFDEENKGIQPHEVWYDDEEVETLEDEPKERKKKKRKMIRVDGSSSSGSGSREEAIKNSLKNFMRWQMQMEVEWIRASEVKEVERKATEMEWRKAMEAVAAERAGMDRRWKEKEEERRRREEERAERRHQLLLALLSKLNSNGI